jgi:2-oxoisovalerate dehydrogenase E1 component
LVTEGDDLTIVTYGLCVHYAKEILAGMPDIKADIVDLRTLLPWDKEAVKKSVLKTGRVIVAHEDTITGGIGGEIAAWIAENCFQNLDAPVMRVASLDTAIPFNPILEQDFLPKQRLKNKIKEIMDY